MEPRTIGSFAFEWTHLRAQVRDFTIHGLEPAGSQPLFHANLVQVDLKLLSPFHGFVDIAYLLLDTPQARVLVFPDGSTNIPAPKIKAKSSNKSGLETIVDLAIGHFDLRNGSLAFGDRKTQMNATGANFRAQLGYNALNPSYKGEIDISPLILQTAGNAPLDVNLKLPVAAFKDRLELTGAEVSTPQSHIVVSGAMDHLVDPRVSAHLNAQVAVEEARRAAGLKMPLDLVHGPRVLMADVTASMADSAIRIQSARIGLGRSNIETSGDLKEANGGAGATFNASLDLGEIGTLLRVSARPEGLVKLGGTARLDARNDYAIAGNIEARQVSIRQNGTRISNLNLDSAVAADNHKIALSNLRLDALGGRFVGAANLIEMAKFDVDGRLEGFNIESLSGVLMRRKLAYNGAISGPIHAAGDVNHMADVAARVNLAIAPAPRRAGIPVSGRLNADYSGRADSVTLAASYIALPHTRVDLSGQPGKQIDVKLVSRSFADFAPLGNIPITLNNGGSAVLTAAITGKLSAPQIAGNATMTNFSAAGRPFTQFSAALAASPNSAALTNASISRGALQMQLAASVGLRDWKLLQTSPLRADATIRNAGVEDVLALAGETSMPVTGAFTMDAHVAGTAGSPTGTVDATASNGAIEGEKYDSFTLHAQMAPQSITVPTLTLVAGASRLTANGSFQHPVNDLSQGTINAHVDANQVQLAQFQSLVKDRPGLAGTVTLNGDGAGVLRAGAFTVSAVNANIAARGLAMEGKPLGDLTATASTAGSAVRYNVSSDFAGSTIRVNGESDLNGEHRTSANASIANLPIDRVLAIAGERDIPVKGTLTANAQVSGTLNDPHASGNVHDRQRRGLSAAVYAFAGIARLHQPLDKHSAIPVDGRSVADRRHACFQSSAQRSRRWRCAISRHGQSDSTRALESDLRDSTGRRGNDTTLGGRRGEAA